MDVSLKDKLDQTAFIVDNKQLVTFQIGNETYGIETGKVKELIGLTKITHIPNSAGFIEGVINLRGIVMPVIDMRKRFRLPVREYDAFSVIIITEVKNISTGIIVDAVSDVVKIPASSVQNTPHFLSKIDSAVIRGIGRIEDELIILLDADMLLNEEESVQVDKIILNQSLNTNKSDSALKN